MLSVKNQKSSINFIVSSLRAHRHTACPYIGIKYCVAIYGHQMLVRSISGGLLRAPTLWHGKCKAEPIALDIGTWGLIADVL